MADNDQQRDPLQAMAGGEQKPMQMGQEPPVHQQQQGQASMQADVQEKEPWYQGQQAQQTQSQQQMQAGQGEDRLTGGGQGQSMPSAAPQSAGEMAQTDAGYGSTAASKEGGLGATQTSYGQSTQQDVTGGLGTQSVNMGAQGQTGVLGKSPGHDKDLTTGLKDQNQGGTSGGGL
jgi:hypothetical protein